MFDNMSPWAIVTKDHKLFNCSSFRTATVNSRVLAWKLPKLSCITRINIILLRYSYRFFCFFLLCFVGFFFTFRDHFCNHTIKEKRYKVKIQTKIEVFCAILWNLFVANLELFELNKFMVPTPSTMSGLPCDDIAREKFWIWKTPTFQIY